MAIPIIQTVGLAVMTLAAIIAAGFILFDNEPLRYEFYDIKNKQFEHKDPNRSHKKEKQVSPESLLTLLQMGFDLEKISVGLKKFQNDVEKTVEWLLQEACNLNDTIMECSNQHQQPESLNFEVQNLEPVEPVRSESVSMKNSLPSINDLESSTPLIATFDSAVEAPVIQKTDYPTENWIYKERRAIQERLEYLEELERSQKYQSSMPLPVNEVFQDQGERNVDFEKRQSNIEQDEYVYNVEANSLSSGQSEKYYGQTDLVSMSENDGTTDTPRAGSTVLSIDSVILGNLN
jgi:hypothetical protein